MGQFERHFVYSTRLISIFPSTKNAGFYMLLSRQQFSVTRLCLKPFVQFFNFLVSLPRITLESPCAWVKNRSSALVGDNYLRKFFSTLLDSTKRNSTIGDHKLYICKLRNLQSVNYLTFVAWSCSFSALPDHATYSFIYIYTCLSALWLLLSSSLPTPSSQSLYLFFLWS